MTFCASLLVIIMGVSSLYIVCYFAIMVAASAHLKSNFWIADHRPLSSHVPIQSYELKGLRCRNCAQKAQEILSLHWGTNNISVIFQPPRIIVPKSISVGEINDVLRSANTTYIACKISEFGRLKSKYSVHLASLAPVVSILTLLGLLAIASPANANENKIDSAMRKYMGGFFTTFSLFKFVNLKGFVESFSSYDLIAQRVQVYAWTYPFVELCLGLCFLCSHSLRATNWATLVLMATSCVGVWRALRSGKTMTCACLGSWFKLPLTPLTLIENALMVMMSLSCLLRNP